MKLSESKLKELILQKIRDNVDSLSDYNGKIYLTHFRDIFNFIRSGEESIETNLLWYDSDIFKHAVLKKMNYPEFLIMGRSRRTFSDSGLKVKLTKIDDLRYECIISESVRCKRNYDDASRLHNAPEILKNGEKVDVRELSFNEIIDWLCIILGCNHNELLARFRYYLRQYGVHFRTLYDEDGQIKDKYKDRNIYEIMQDVFTRGDLLQIWHDSAIYDNWQYAKFKRGWTAEHKLELDISSALVEFGNKEAKIFDVARERILGSISDTIKLPIDLQKLNLENFVNKINAMTEMATIDSLTDVFYEFTINFADHQDIFRSLLNESYESPFIYNANHEWTCTIAMKPVESRGHKYSISIAWTIYESYHARTLMLCENDEHIKLDIVVEEVLRSRGLDDRYYDEIYEEILETVERVSLHGMRLEENIEIDFSDLFED